MVGGLFTAKADVKAGLGSSTKGCVAWREPLAHPGHLASLARNNHTEIVLIKTLLGPFSLASYWLTLTS